MKLAFFHQQADMFLHLPTKTISFLNYLITQFLLSNVWIFLTAWFLGNPRENISARFPWKILTDKYYWEVSNLIQLTTRGHHMTVYKQRLIVWKHYFSYGTLSICQIAKSGVVCQPLLQVQSQSITSKTLRQFLVCTVAIVLQYSKTSQQL